MKRVLNFLALFRRERRPGDLVFAFGFFLLACLMLVVLPAQAKFLPGKELVGQPGFWPSIGVGMMVLFGGVHLVSTYNAPRLPGRLREVMVWLRALEFVVWFIAYVLLVPRLGYLPATVLFAVILGVRLGYRSPRALLAAVLFALVVVLVFRAGLSVRLPAGALYQYLPDGLRNFAMIYL